METIKNLMSCIYKICWLSCKTTQNVSASKNLRILPGCLVLGGGMSWLGTSASWGFSFSAVVHHCPWCAEWPRASHFSPSRFCLLRDTELWWMVIISPLCGEIVGKEIIFKPLPPKCLSAAVPARSAKLFKLPCLFCQWNLSKYPVPRKRYIWDVNNWNVLFLAHRESDTTALP